MRIDAGLTITQLADVPARAREMEALGYDGLFTFEGQTDPFLPLVLAAEHTTRPQLMTAVALAFPRSPMTLAYVGHDLQVQSGGRFVLGLGAQIRVHVEKRYGAAWNPPVARMREYVLALRAIWRCWNEGECLDFRGTYWTHTLMTPIFVPAPSPWGPPKVFLAAVQPRMTEVAGEVADGIFVHPFHSPRFLDERLLPALARGLGKAGRQRGDVEIGAQVLLVTGADEEAIAQSAVMVRQQLAFYASTPAYRPVLEVHGWGDLQTELHALTKQGRWVEMGDRITDEMLEAFAVRGTPEELPAKLRARYGRRVERLSLSTHSGLETADRERWRAVVAALR